MEFVLEFKWSVSRGRDTYGYNICSLFVNGKKSASCNGGNYDMKGTSLGNWFAARFADRLMKLEIPMNRRNGEDVQEYYGLSYHDPNFDPGKVLIEGKTIEEREAEGLSLGLERYQAFYHESSNVPTERHTVPLINGACGFSSVTRIINACGFGLKYISGTSKTDTYLMTELKEEGTC